MQTEEDTIQEAKPEEKKETYHPSEVLTGRRILAVAWFSPARTPEIVGVVLVKDPYNGLCAYIGIGSGNHSGMDTVHIARWGAKFPVEMAIELTGYIDPEKAGKEKEATPCQTSKK